MRWAGALLILLAAATAARGDAPPGQDYMLYCMGCHLRDGGGMAERVPPLVGVDRFLRVPAGRAYLVRVPGVANAALSDARIAALLNWVLDEYGEGPFEPFAEEEVGPLRKDPFLDASAARRALLESISESGD